MTRSSCSAHSRRCRFRLRLGAGGGRRARPGRRRTDRVSPLTRPFRRPPRREGRRTQGGAPGTRCGEQQRRSSRSMAPRGRVGRARRIGGDGAGGRGDDRDDPVRIRRGLDRPGRAAELSTDWKGAFDASSARREPRSSQVHRPGADPRGRRATRGARPALARACPAATRPYRHLVAASSNARDGEPGSWPSPARSSRSIPACDCDPVRCGLRVHRRRKRDRGARAGRARARARTDRAGPGIARRDRSPPCVGRDSRGGERRGARDDEPATRPDRPNATGIRRSYRCSWTYHCNSWERMTSSSLHLPRVSRERGVPQR